MLELDLTAYYTNPPLTFNYINCANKVEKFDLLQIKSCPGNWCPLFDYY